MSNRQRNKDRRLPRRLKKQAERRMEIGDDQQNVFEEMPMMRQPQPKIPVAAVMAGTAHRPGGYEFDRATRAYVPANQGAEVVELSKVRARRKWRRFLLWALALILVTGGAGGAYWRLGGPVFG